MYRVKSKYAAVAHRATLPHSRYSPRHTHAFTCCHHYQYNNYLLLNNLLLLQLLKILIEKFKNFNFKICIILKKRILHSHWIIIEIVFSVKYLWSITLSISNSLTFGKLLLVLWFAVLYNIISQNNYLNHNVDYFYKLN